MKRELTLGSHWSFNLRNDPKRLAFVLSRYKFAAGMLGKGRKVLELGCSEGIGAPILSEFARSYTGIDLDAPAIEAARANFGRKDRRFLAGDFLDKRLGRFDAVVSLDVIEHIHLRYEPLFFSAVLKNLEPDGVCVIGTPNKTSEAYASELSREGHVNVYDAERLTAAMRLRFRNVFLLGLNDEVVHTGFAPMTHYLAAVGCRPIPAGAA
jgi:2-polyprenyl-3-methyl-5-hydroxy-6-metoxy-1,4-benzoquinol methylase